MIAIIKYNAGNVASVQNALKRLGYESVVTDNPDLILEAKKVIFPGVGEASSALHYLRERNLDVLITSLKQPVLGICLGLQLMCTFSEEGHVKGLDIFKTMVRRFPVGNPVPHMGWNTVIKSDVPLFSGLTSQDDFYFVHSYCAALCEDTIATCAYTLSFSAALQKDNFYATQFHPEKSRSAGEKILLNFLKIENL